jgi:hypothetical protein
MPLLEGSSYSVDPLGIICAAYAVSGLSMSLVLDVFSQIGQKAEEFRWAVGIHPAVLRENDEIKVSSAVPMDFLESSFEDELDDMCFVRTGGGCESMLVKVTGRGELARLLAALSATGLDNSDSGMIPDSEIERIPVAPMFAVPEAPPAAAMFISTRATQEPKGVLVTDTVQGDAAVRILDVSPRAPRLCAIAVIQDLAERIGHRRIVDLVMDPGTEMSDDDAKGHACTVFRGTCSVVRSNLPTERLLMTAATGLRAAGFTSYRHDDPDDQTMDIAEQNFITYVVRNKKELIDAMRRTIRDLVSLAENDYTASNPRVKVSKDPESDNRNERARRIEKKMKTRASIYKVRIRTAKSKFPAEPRDKMSDYDSQVAKLAYLAGAMNLMNSVDFDAGPVINWESTARHLAGAITKKKQKMGWEGDVVADDICAPSGKLELRRLINANLGVDGNFWRPEEYARGVMRAVGWVEGDCINETQEVYFVPRTVQVRTRVRRTYVHGDRREYERIRAEIVAVEKQEPDHDPVVVPVVEKPAEPPRMSIRERMRAANKKPVRTLEDYRSWLGTLDTWAISLMSQEGSIDEPDGFAQKNWTAVMMLGRKAKDKHFEPGYVDALRDKLASSMYSSKAAMIAPSAEDEDADMGLVM